MGAAMNIPPAALEAGARAIEQSLRTARLTLESEDGYKPEARAAFVAMVEAWEGMKMTPWWEFTTHKKRVDLILPLMENPDDKA